MFCVQSFILPFPRCPNREAMKTPPVFIVGFCELNPIIRIIITIKLSATVGVCLQECSASEITVTLALNFFSPFHPPLTLFPPAVLGTMVTFLKHKLEYYLLAQKALVPPLIVVCQLFCASASLWVLPNQQTYHKDSDSGALE